MVTMQRTVVRNEEQRSQDRRARCNRVHSAVTKKVKVNEGRKVNIHAVLELFTSGQLLFLGSMDCRSGRAGRDKAGDGAGRYAALRAAQTGRRGDP